ncbi:MAG TPA: hypothetical protein VF934_09640 [Burkholderiales bacterium]
MKIRKILLYVASTVLGLFVLLLTSIWVINVFDEDLNPEIVALVKRAESEQIAQQGNAYFSIRGLNAAKGQDIEVAGRALDEADRRALEAFKNDDDAKRISAPDPANALKFEGQSSNLCTVTEDYLYERGVCKFLAETERMFQDNVELLQRYYSLFDYGIYEEPATFASYPQRDLISLMRLANVDMERKLYQGQIEHAAKLMARNLAFWRNVMGGKYRLLSEAVVRVNYNYSLTALSDLLWRKPGMAKSADFRVAIGEPIMSSTKGLQGQMDREFMNAYLVKKGSDLLYIDAYGGGTIYGGSARSVLKWIADRMFQKNATFNDYHACLKKYYDVRALSGAERDQAISSYKAYEMEESSGTLVSNIAGKIALQSMCPKRYWFDALVADNFLEARRRLVLLEINLLSSKRPESAYAALLRDSNAGLHDPVTGEPAKWDAERRTIYFERVKGCSEERLRVTLGPAKEFAHCPS